MNDQERETIEALRAWKVETSDVTARVASAIGATPDLATEMRAMTTEMAELRRVAVRLQEEIACLRAEMKPRSSTRLTPFAPTDSLVRLS